MWGGYGAGGLVVLKTPEYYQVEGAFPWPMFLPAIMR